MEMRWWEEASEGNLVSIRGRSSASSSTSESSVEILIHEHFSRDEKKAAATLAPTQFATLAPTQLATFSYFINKGLCVFLTEDDGDIKRSNSWANNIPCLVTAGFVLECLSWKGSKGVLSNSSIGLKVLGSGRINYRLNGHTV